MKTKLAYDLFLKTFKNAPRVAINLIITDKNNRVLLVKRANPPFLDFWHFPGSFLLKGEKLNNCLTCIAKKELRLVINSHKTQLLGVFEDLNKDPRGHVVDILYGYKVDNFDFKPVEDSKEIQFFDKLPKKIGFNHRETLEKLGFK